MGIGGIGMSAIARYFNALGIAVSGYDRTPTALTEKLISEGIEIVFNDDPSSISEQFLSAPLLHSLVVYTPAIPAGSPLLGYFASRGYGLLKRSEVLAEITEPLDCLAVAGTHGKTTTSAMLAHLLTASDYPINAFLGGIALNFDSNVVLSAHARAAVVEADEYDRSFLRLSPKVAILTSVDADHLDIYESAEAMQQGFADFLGKVDADGVAIVKYGIELPSAATQLSYSLTDTAADLYASQLRVEEGHYHFNLHYKGTLLEGIESGYPGLHNIENLIAAMGVALYLDVAPAKLRHAAKTFRGVKRRFDVKLRRDDLIYIDDYAHHPTEITACIDSVKSLYPAKRITGVFQPHLYSRTRDFADEFATSLEALNELLLMEIYPAREEPIPGVDSRFLLNKIQMVNKKLVDRENLVNEVLSLRPEVLLSMGAGDIDKMVEPLKNALDDEA